MADDPFRPRKRFNVGRVLTGLVVIFAATFGIAYYMPLSKAHSALAQEHQSLTSEQQSVSQQLKETTAQLQATQKERDELKAKLGKIDDGEASEVKRAQDLHNEISGALEKRAGRKDLAIASSANTTVIVIDDAKLFRGHQAHVNPIGKAILCDVAKAVKGKDVSLQIEGHTTDDEVSNPILRKDYPTTLELSAVRAAGATLALGQCGVDRKQMVAAGVGHHRPLPETKKGSSGQIKIVVTPRGDG